MLIRDERPCDEAAIQVVIADAFRDMPFSDQTEVFIMPALRRAGALALSLVAEEDGEIVGQAAFSPVTIDGKPGGWYGLGPIAVPPGRQRQGIGSALIAEGLARLRALGADGCLLVGHPDYYPRFGFRHEPQLTVPGVPPEAFMILPFGKVVPAGKVAFHPAFAATA
jgi:putative acetyltransferase